MEKAVKGESGKRFCRLPLQMAKSFCKIKLAENSRERWAVKR